MSIRPVDLQVIIPKAAEAGNSNQTHGRAEVQQHQFSQQLNKQIEHDSQSVIKTSSSDKQGMIDKDGKNKQENSKKRKKFSDKAENKEGEKKAGGNNLFDVRI